MWLPRPPEYLDPEPSSPPREEEEWFSPAHLGRALVLRSDQLDTLLPPQPQGEPSLSLICACSFTPPPWLPGTGRLRVIQRPLLMTTGWRAVTRETLLGTKHSTHQCMFHSPHWSHFILLLI